MVRVKLFGAGGYGGIGLVELLHRHPEARLVALVDIEAFRPRRVVDTGQSHLFAHGRTQGVIRSDYTVDTDYTRKVFMADLAAAPVILLRRMGLLRAY